ncbi:MAG: TorF family putative porin, partial [Alteriqipengyuania sp.]
MNLFKLAPVAVLSATLLASPALAQDEYEEEADAIEISGNVSLVSDYRFRGVSFSDEDIAIQGGIDLAHESGFYVGTWA